MTFYKTYDREVFVVPEYDVNAKYKTIWDGTKSYVYNTETDMVYSKQHFVGIRCRKDGRDYIRHKEDIRVTQRILI